MQNAQALYALNIDQLVNLLTGLGPDRTVLIEGDMGIGKSTLLKLVNEKLPGHHPAYFDCTTKDVGDMFIPRISDAETGAYVGFVPNEEFGLHHGKPVILMFDELGKANPSVKLAVNRTMLERTVGNTPLPAGSIVFATTNLGAEGVGDLLKAHTRNRLTVVRMRKPTSTEWIEWGINNGVNPTVLGWVKDNPQVMTSFTEYDNPEENPYIYHPKAVGRAAFVTPRSLHAASDILNVDGLDDDTVTSALIGTIGDRGAMDLAAYVKLANQLPRREEILNDPMGAKVPDSVSGVCMVVYRALATMSADFVDAWMTYLDRLNTEAQGLFANGVRAETYSKRGMVMTNKKFTAWAMANGYMFAADKK